MSPRDKDRSKLPPGPDVGSYIGLNADQIDEVFAMVIETTLGDEYKDVNIDELSEDKKKLVDQVIANFVSGLRKP